MSLHPDHAQFGIREQYRRELLALSQQQRLANLAGQGRSHDGLALAVRACLHRLTALATQAQPVHPVPVPDKPPALSLANGGASFPPRTTR